MIDVLTTDRPQLHPATMPQAEVDARDMSVRALVAYRNRLLAELRFVEREIEAITRPPAD